MSEQVARQVEVLDYALNESLVCGVRYDERAAIVRLYLEVLARGTDGSLDPDPRRILVLSGVTSLEIRRSVDMKWVPLVDPQPQFFPVSGLDMIEELLKTAGLYDVMDGWEFLDLQAPPPWRRAEPALLLGPGPSRTGRSLDWDVEVGHLQSDDVWTRQLIDGTVYFTDVEMTRADGTVLSLDTIDGDATRFWKAAFDRTTPEKSNPSTRAQRRQWRSGDGSNELEL